VQNNPDEAGGRGGFDEGRKLKEGARRPGGK